MAHLKSPKQPMGKTCMELLCITSVIVCNNLVCDSLSPRRSAKCVNALGLGMLK